MNTLIFTDEFPKKDGGIAQVAYEVAKQMRGLGEDVIVLTSRTTIQDDEFDKKQSFKIIRIKCINNRWFRFLYTAVSFINVLAKYKISIIYTTPWFPCGFISYVITKFVKCPYLVINHGYEITIPQESFLRRFLMIRTLNNAKYNFCVSEFTKEKVIKLGINHQKVFFIPNGVNIVKFRPNIDPTKIIERYKLKGKKVILTVGRFQARKGHDMVIKSLPEIIKDIPNVIYLMAGNDHGAKKDIKELVKNLDLANYVLFLDYVSDEDIAALYNACDIFIMPSKQIGNDFEGFGIVFLEANACEKPVIGGNAGGVPSAVIDGFNGLLVEPLDLKELTGAIKKLLIDKELAQLLGKQGRKRVEESLTWEIIVKKMMEIVSSKPSLTKDPVNLMYVIDNLEIGGTQELILTTLKAINRRKYNVIVASLFSGGKILDEILKQRIKVYELGMRNKYGLAVVLKMTRIMKKEKIKIVHTHLALSDFYGRLAAKLAGMPVIVTTYHNVIFDKKFHYFWGDRLMRPFTDKMITVSGAVKDWMIKHERINPSKLLTIHNAVDLDKFSAAVNVREKRKSLNVGEKELLIGVVAALAKQKNVSCILKAMVKIIKVFPEVKLLIVGDGPLKSELKDLSSKLKIGKNILFYGQRRDIPEILSIIDVFTIAPLFEGFGIVLLEAMISGKPVVATRIGGIPEIITDQKTGFLVSPDKPEALADVVLKLLENNELARSIGERGEEISPGEI